MNHCKGIMGRLFGHKIEHQYDEQSDPTGMSLSLPDTVWSGHLAEMIEANKKTKSTYRGSICVRCGLTFTPMLLERSKPLQRVGEGG